MKRFTETTKWIDPWFRKLSPPTKLLWLYLCDNCDTAGIIELDIDAASFCIGSQVGDSNLKEIGDRLDRKEGKLLIRKYVMFQHGRLTPDCNAHKPGIASVERYNLVMDDNGYRYPTAKEAEELAKGRGRVGLGYHKDSALVLESLNKLSGKKFRNTETNLGFISQRLSEPEVTTEGVIKMVERQCKRWAGTERSEYLRPETLFGKTKFDGYYAAKDQPIAEQANHKPLPKYGPHNPLPGSVPNNGF